jgi:hypothetical protein
MYRLFVLIFLSVLPSVVFSQITTDSTSSIKSPSARPDEKTITYLPLYEARPAGPFRPSPRRATLLAVALPGAGQLYNRRYWKVPIVYTGFVVLGYFILDNDRQFKTYRDAYILRYKGDRTTASLYNRYPNIRSLSVIREFYRRNRDLSVILTGAWYGITIIDAVVDAHLYSFSVSDDLEASLRPTAVPLAFSQGYAPGINLTLHWH